MTLSEQDILNLYHSTTTKPIGLWHFDEFNWSGTPGEVYDDSGEDNHGTAENGADTVASGKIERAGIFDGTDDYVDIGDAPVLNITGDQLTLAAWVNISEFPSNYMGILSKGGYSDGYRCLVDSSGAILFQLTGSSYSLTTDTTISPGVWHHIVATYDGSNMRVYIDGEKDSSEEPRTGNIDPNNNPLWIGHGDQAAGQSWGYPFKGFIDEVRVYDVALSEQDILNLYQDLP